MGRFGSGKSLRKSLRKSIQGSLDRYSTDSLNYNEVDNFGFSQSAATDQSGDHSLGNYI